MYVIKRDAEKDTFYYVHDIRTGEKWRERDTEHAGMSSGRK